MNNPLETSPQRPDNTSPLLPDWIGEVISTSPRFSLSHDRSAAEAIDVVAHDQVEGYGRFLITNEDGIDETIWSQMQQNDVPRLPLLLHKDGIWTFGIKDGLKPLSQEALFGHQSSETYIGDPEIYHEMGLLYRSMYDATKALMLEGPVEEDSPLDHVAIFSFSDERNFLYLYPPFKIAPEYRNLSQDEASTLFRQSLKAALSKQMQYHESPNDTIDQLLQTAQAGFNGL